MKLTTRGRATAEAIRDRKPFTTSGSMYAMTCEGYVATLGQLPGEAREALKEAERAHAVDYVVYSYSTPIAWHTAEGWTVPNVRYSVTTSKHQGNLYLIGEPVSRPTGGHVMRDGAGRVYSSTGGPGAY